MGQEVILIVIVVAFAAFMFYNSRKRKKQQSELATRWCRVPASCCRSVCTARSCRWTTRRSPLTSRWLPAPS